ncbi:response regulator transcription factor [Pseudooceanicola onchidii]|uniref:response regulator transcription factor n=1 Tax=Pseudooceanicola onchidii TaxID=2562279 RepID=UPI00145BFCCC|nr:response regulator transcription factor [Pseudooceanicola onchidii]
MRILLTDTTWNMAILAKELRDAGFFVTEAGSGAELTEFARLGEQDAILIDPDLPDGDAHDLVRRLRSLNRHIPICLFTRKVDDQDLTRALINGADDVIRWPDHGVGDILARLRAYVRRAAGFATTEVEVGGLVIDLEQQVVRYGDMPVHLTRLEYELIETMALRNGRLISRDQIMLQLYAWKDEPDAKIIDVYICRLRAKMAAAGATEEVIVTSFAQGYRLNTIPVEATAVAA